MSLIGSLLALVAIPLKAKSRNLAAERPRELDNLALLAMAEEIKLLQFALDHWRKSGNALMLENERLRADNWRMRDALAQGDVTPANRRLPITAQQFMQRPDLIWSDCTCVPSRAQAFGIGQTEPLPP